MVHLLSSLRLTFHVLSLENYNHFFSDKTGQIKAKTRHGNGCTFPHPLLQIDFFVRLSCPSTLIS